MCERAEENHFTIRAFRANLRGRCVLARLPVVERCANVRRKHLHFAPNLVGRVVCPFTPPSRAGNTIPTDPSCATLSHVGGRPRCCVHVHGHTHCRKCGVAFFVRRKINNK